MRIKSTPGGNQTSDLLSSTPKVPGSIPGGVELFLGSVLGVRGALSLVWYLPVTEAALLVSISTWILLILVSLFAGVRVGRISARSSSRPGRVDTESMAWLSSEERFPQEKTEPNYHRFGLEELEGKRNYIYFNVCSIPKSFFFSLFNFFLFLICDFHVFTFYTYVLHFDFFLHFINLLFFFLLLLFYFIFIYFWSNFKVGTYFEIWISTFCIFFFIFILFIYCKL